MKRLLAPALLFLLALPAAAQEKSFTVAIDQLAAPFAEVAKGRGIDFPITVGTCYAGGTPFCGYENGGGMLMAFGDEAKGPTKWVELHGMGETPAEGFVTAATILMRVFDPKLTDAEADGLMQSLLTKAGTGEVREAGVDATFIVHVQPHTHSFRAEPR